MSSRAHFYSLPFPLLPILTCHVEATILATPRFLPDCLSVSLQTCRFPFCPTAVTNANTTAMKTEETTINRLFPHALSQKRGGWHCADTRDQPALSLRLHQCEHRGAAVGGIVSLFREAGCQEGYNGCRCRQWRQCRRLLRRIADDDRENATKDERFDLWGTLIVDRYKRIIQNKFRRYTMLSPNSEVSVL